MPSLEDVNSRTPTCRKCKGRFRVVIPTDETARHRLISARVEGGVRFIRDLRELTGASLTDAKAVMQHVSRANAACHACGAALESGVVTDCPRCRSLNIALEDTDRR
jgi:hypothetical protein